MLNLDQGLILYYYSLSKLRLVYENPFEVTRFVDHSMFIFSALAVLQVLFGTLLG